MTQDSGSSNTNRCKVCGNLYLDEQHRINHPRGSSKPKRASDGSLSDGLVEPKFSNIIPDGGSSKSVDDPCHGLVPHGNYQKCPVSPSDSVGTACSKCGKPFMVGDTIIGNEAGSWHGDCRLHAVVEASDPETESTDMRKDDPSVQQAQVSPENDSTKPPVNEIAAILFSELFNNKGMTIVGKVEKALPRIEALVAAETTKANKALLESLTEHQIDSQDLQRSTPGFSHEVIPASVVYDRIKELEESL